MKLRKLTKCRKFRPFVVSPQKAVDQLNDLLATCGMFSPMPRRVTPFSIDLKPEKFPDPESFALSYLASNLLSKYDDGKPSPEKESETWRRFHAAEEMCLSTNRRLKHARGTGLDPSLYEWQVMVLATQKMHALLGEFSWDDASRYFGWGPGSSTRLPRRLSDAVFKYSGRPDTTIGNVILANACIMRSPLWQESLTFEEGAGYCNIVPGNRVITVPKNYKTHRTIAVEPCMNMYVQKGIGGVLRRKLRRVGVDLDDQTRNQRLALIGSFAGTLATIDMSMASDTVSYELVRLLLPPDWFEALEQCRSLFGVLPSGEKMYYQKFSSMGNGYTFELESAIFYCLASAVADLHKVDGTRIAVYGDDVIVPTALAEPLMKVLSFAGFKPNWEKTFVSGPFRESCGKHYFRGYDVTPFFVKRPVKSLKDLFLLHNQIYRWCLRCQWMQGKTLSKFRRLINNLRSIAPVAWRKPRIPDGIGDGAFMGTFDEVQPTLKREYRNRGWEGFTVVHLADVSRSIENESLGRLLKALQNIRGTMGSYDPRFVVEGVEGGVALPPRTREVTTLVAQFPLVDPFTKFG